MSDGGRTAETNPYLSASLVPSPELTPGPRGANSSSKRCVTTTPTTSGFEIAFRFASPANKVNTGPLPRFIDMIKNGPYALMLNFLTAIYDPVEIVDDVARQRVTLFGSHTAIAYVFYLSRQSEGPCIDCWMTDAVTIEPLRGRQAQLSAAARFRI